MVNRAWRNATIALVVAAARVAAAQKGVSASNGCPPDLASAIAQAADDRSVARLRLCRGHAREETDQSGALDDYDVSIDAARRAAVRDVLADALVTRGEIEYDRGDFRRSIEDLNESYQLHTALGNTDRVYYVLNAIANLYADARMGQYERALDYYRQILERQTREGHQA